MFDVNEIDEAFKFTKETANYVITEILTELQQRHLSKKISSRVLLNVFKKNFTLKMIWDRINLAEKKEIFKSLNPEEILELKEEGVSFGELSG